jgi:hypothetical protein
MQSTYLIPSSDGSDKHKYITCIAGSQIGQRLAILARTKICSEPMSSYIDGICELSIAEGFESGFVISIVGRVLSVDGIGVRGGKLVYEVGKELGGRDCDGLVS